MPVEGGGEAISANRACARGEMLCGVHLSAPTLAVGSEVSGESDGNQTVWGRSNVIRVCSNVTSYILRVQGRPKLISSREEIKSSSELLRIQSSPNHVSLYTITLQ
jgi:hypothetical protein